MKAMDERMDSSRPDDDRDLAAAARSTRWHRMAGVTLLELMTVVMVIGILSIVALPSYRQYTMRAHRTEAKTALLQLATNQERYYLQNRTYGTIAQLTAAGYPTASEYGVYALTITTTNGLTQDYTATATPTAGGGTNGVHMAEDSHCATFSLTSTGIRNATNPDCW
jgi:type IV pilus assembly protein PilE